MSEIVSDLLGRRLRIWLAIGVVTLIVYAVAGFFVVPQVVRHQLQTYVSQTLHRQMTLGALRFNPFTLTLRAADLSLREAGGSPLVGFNYLVVNIELASLWQRAINLKEISIDTPDVQLIIDRDGSVNLARLLPPSGSATGENAANKVPEKVRAPPRVRIGLLAVRSGRVGIEDRTSTKPFTTALAPIEFTLTEFKTDLDYQNAYQFSAVSLAGEQLEWSGEFSVQPLSSSGQFVIQRLKAATIQSYLRETLPFVLASGELGLAGRYRVAIDPALALEVDLSTVAVKDLAVTERNAEAVVLITLPSVDVNDVAFSYTQRSVNVKSVALRDPQIALTREPDGTTNLSRLFAPDDGARASEATVSADIPATVPLQASSSQTPVGKTQSWQASIETIQVVDGAVTLIDNSVVPTARFSLQPVALTINRWSTAADAGVHIGADVTIDRQSKLSVEGDIKLTPLDALLGFKLDRLSLPSLQSYLAQATQLTLHSGSLSAQGKVALVEDPKATRIRFTGDVSIDDLRTTDKLSNDDFVKWQRLAIVGIAYSSNPDRLSIERVTAQQPYARVVIAADQSVNVAQVISAPGEGGAATEKSLSGQAQLPDAQASSAKASSMPIRINSIQVIDGAANFADYSIQPAFATGILDLNGTVTGLSSATASRAQVKFAGKVDRYAPVDITGEINILSAAKYSDVALKFSNMELTTFNPYSGKFAGYNISKGKLSTELRYRVEDRKLDAQHHIVIDNLEFGDKTDSKDAAPIPLKLAIALLRDRNGVIDLELPVAGTLDDPEFRLTPIIWKAFLGVLKKVASAPFAAIGALIGGGDELAYVDFVAGSATLARAEIDKLNKLAQGLAERPQLRLNIPLHAVGERDSDELAKQALRALLPPALAAAPINATTQQQRVAVLETALKKTKVVQYPVEAARSPEAKLDYLQKELLRTLEPNDSVLDALARRRASAVQAILLLNPAVEPQRVFLTNELMQDLSKSDVRATTTSTDSVRMEMQLE